MATLADFGEIIFAFPVLYAGWECDSKGYVIRDSSGVNKLVLSSHGAFYIAEASELEEKIAEYQEAISNSQAALKLLNNSQREEWWRDPSTEICLFHIPARPDGTHVLTLNGRKINGRWEYAILQWWHKSPTLWIAWVEDEMLEAHPDMQAMKTRAI